MPTARKGMASCVMNGKIYVFSGVGTGAVEVYDPVTDTWTKKKDIAPRLGAAAAAVNGKIYFIGGYPRTPVVEMYDSVTDTWQKRANMPTGIWGTGYAAVDGKIYLFGGATSRVIDTTYEYDPVADKWTQKADMPIPKWFLSASVLDGKLYAIGGNRTATGAPSASMDVCDPATDTWTEGVAMQTARGGLAMAVVDSKIYAFGGNTGIHFGNLGTVFATVEEYTPEGLESTTTAVSPQGKLTTTWGEIKRHLVRRFSHEIQKARDST